MTHRTDRVYLPPGAARCDPGAVACRHRHSCARYMASLPASGARLQNFALTPAYRANGFCDLLLPLNFARPPAPQAAEPKVHPPLGSAP